MNRRDFLGFLTAGATLGCVPAFAATTSPRSAEQPKVEGPVLQVERPPAAWFAAVAGGGFGSQDEILHDLAIPLLGYLGYANDEFNIPEDAEPHPDDTPSVFVEILDTTGRYAPSQSILKARCNGTLFTDENDISIFTDGKRISVVAIHGAWPWPSASLVVLGADELSQRWDEFYEVGNREAVMRHKTGPLFVIPARTPG